LLQNTDETCAEKTIYTLSNEGLVFAHDGVWSTVDNFKSLNDGCSDKNPKECIGHKGLGSRSVQDITPSPFLVKIGGEQFLEIKYS